VDFRCDALELGTAGQGTGDRINQMLDLSGRLRTSIFDASAAVSELKEACLTIRKSIVQSENLHDTVGSDPLAMNQMVRWINTKEEHCSKIIKLVSLPTREASQIQHRGKVSPHKEKYLQALKVHHTVMQAVMKAKKSMDEGVCDMLEHAVADLAKMYSK
jgi:small subunit ribosomal protein S27Ae